MKRLILLTVFILLVACNSTVIKVSPSYTSPSPPEEVNCALIIPEFIDVSYKASVEKSLGPGLNTQVIPSFFREHFYTELRKASRFNKMYNSYLLEDFPSRKKRFSTRHGQRAISIPLPGEKIKCQSVEPEIVVKLENIAISSQAPGKEDVSKENTEKSGSLFLRTEFMIWDNVKGKLVSHGYVEVSRNGKSSITKDSWISLTAEAASLIMKGTPFAVKTTS